MTMLDCCPSAKATKNKMIKLRICLMAMVLMPLMLIAVSANKRWSSEPERTLSEYCIGNEKVALTLKDQQTLKKAQQGDARAQCEFAMTLRTRAEKAIDASRLFADAFAWAMKSAKQGCADGENFVGWCYENGKGIPVDVNKGLLWRTKAAEHGFKWAQNYLARHYLARQDYRRGFSWAEKAAHDNYAPGLVTLGGAYFLGLGVTTNHAKAVKCLLAAAKQGETDAMWKLGVCYETGVGLGKDLVRAKKLYAKSAALTNCIAQIRLAAIYLQEKNYCEYVNSMERGVLLKERDKVNYNTTDHEYMLGIILKAGARGVKPDPARAMRYLRRAADKGSADAQYELADSFAKGNGCEQNYKQANKYFEKAANQGNAKSCMRLADAYLNGYGVPMNKKLVAMWAERAANLGSPEGQRVLGLCYLNGLGVTCDVQKAKTLLEKAAARGNDEAKKSLAAIKSDEKRRAKEANEAAQRELARVREEREAKERRAKEVADDAQRKTVFRKKYGQYYSKLDYYNLEEYLFNDNSECTELVLMDKSTGRTCQIVYDKRGEVFQWSQSIPKGFAEELLLERLRISKCEKR